MSYDIVFWADAGTASNYKLDLAAGTVTIDYADGATITANSEARDAFYAKKTLASISGNVEESVTLTRPMAQLNWGSDDLSANVIRRNTPVAEIDFTVTIPSGSIATVFNLTDGTSNTENSSAVTFKATGTPAASDGDFPISGYEYIQMDYLLPLISLNDGEYTSKTVLDPITLTAQHTGFTDSEGNDCVTVTVNNAPLQSNYRTNIYGSLLTDPTVYHMTVDSCYTGEYNNILRIYSVDDFELLQTAAYSSATAVLMTDIDLQYYYFGLIGSVDLNGYTMTAQGASTDSLSVDLAISNGTLKLTSGQLYLAQGSSLALDGVTVVMENTSENGGSSNSSGIYYSNGVDITINNSTLTTYAYDEGASSTGIINSKDQSKNTSTAEGSIVIKNSTLNVTNAESNTSTSWVDTDVAAVRNQVPTVSITIDSCTINSGYVGIYTTTGAEIAVTNTTINAGSYGFYYAFKDAMLTYSADETGSNKVYDAIDKQPVSTITMNNNTITAYGYGIYDQNGVLNIENSTISVTEGQIGTSGNAKVYAAYGIYNYCGSVTSSSNKITATVPETNSYTGTYTQSGGYALYNKNGRNGMSSITVSTGDTLSGSTSAYGQSGTSKSSMTVTN